MSTILVMGDIHNHITQAQIIINKYIDTHKIVMTGDYFDDFNDTAADAAATAEWLKNMIKHPNIVALMGNHDINYHYKNFHGSSFGGIIYNCSGYSPAKDDVISNIMSKQDWDGIKFAHKENGFWFSHAGFHPFWFSDPVHGMNDDVINMKLQKIMKHVDDRVFSDELAAAGRCRGGGHRVGGLLWRDAVYETYSDACWNDESGLKQVYGHTPRTTGVDVVKTANGGLCINVDCGLSEVVEIQEDGTFNVMSTGLENFYCKKKK